MRILTVSVTARGAALARRLPWEHAHGALGDTVRSEWGEVDGFVLMCATGIAVRVISGLLADKATDPAVVCVDESGTYAVALCGGHAGANALAQEVAALLGATAVITTATDAAGLPSLDGVPGFTAHGDVAGVTRALLDGLAVSVLNPLEWPVPWSGQPGFERRIVVTDAVVPASPGVVAVHPPSLVIGIGASSDASADDVRSLVASSLDAGGLCASSVSVFATIDRRRALVSEAAVSETAVSAAVGRVPVVAYEAAALDAVDVPNPRAVVRDAVGTASVAEAAALLAAGAGAELIVEKQVSSRVTVAVARRARPMGELAVVGAGPGDARHRTSEASAAVRAASVVIGYGPYVDQVADAISPGAAVRRSPIGEEQARVKTALACAADGERVALVCGGDSGVYALATLVWSSAPSFPPLAIRVVPGVTAAVAAAAVLGAPLGHDHASISLSDLLTPWEIIEARLRAAAEGDFVVALYNPRSSRRGWQLPAALAILASCRPPSTPVGIVTDAGRAGEKVTLSTLETFDPRDVGMTTIVIVGSSTTQVIGGHMVTPRGYER